MDYRAVCFEIRLCFISYNIRTKNAGYSCMIRKRRTFREIPVVILLFVLSNGCKSKREILKFRGKGVLGRL